MDSLRAPGVFNTTLQWIKLNKVEEMGTRGANFAHKHSTYNVVAQKECLSLDPADNQVVTNLYVRIMSQSSCYIYAVTNSDQGHQESINCSKTSIPTCPDYQFLVEFISSAKPEPWFSLTFKGEFNQNYHILSERYDFLLPQNLRDYFFLIDHHPELAKLLKQTNLSQNKVKINFADRVYTLSTERDFSYSTNGVTKSLTLSMKVFSLTFRYVYKLSPSNHFHTSIPETVETDLHLRLLEKALEVSSHGGSSEDKSKL